MRLLAFRFFLGGGDGEGGVGLSFRLRLFLRSLDTVFLMACLCLAVRLSLLSDGSLAGFSLPDSAGEDSLSDPPAEDSLSDGFSSSSSPLEGSLESPAWRWSCRRWAMAALLPPWGRWARSRWRRSVAAVSFMSWGSVVSGASSGAGGAAVRRGMAAGGSVLRE